MAIKFLVSAGAISMTLAAPLVHMQVATCGAQPIAPYMGPYTTTPEDFVQTLATRDKRMTDDVTIYKVPFWETSNLHNGKTVIIGRNYNG